MDNTIDQWDQFTRDALHLAGHTDEQIEAIRIKGIEEGAQKAEPYIPVVLTNDELRQQREETVRHQLDRDHPGHDCTEADIKAHVAVTHSDEAIAEHARQWRAQKRAKEMADAEKYAEDLQRQKVAAAVAKGHSDRLADANKVAMTYQERAEAAEKRNKSLEDQLSGMMKAQRTGGR
jgi:hypothetical protein